MSVKTPFQIEIPKRAAECKAGGELFHPGTEYFSLLLPSEEEGRLERQDYCPSCWEKIRSGQYPSGRCTWKSLVPLKKDSSELPKQRDARALHLLKNTLSNDTPEMHAEAFILSLYLARRRLILLREELALEGGKQALLYEVAATEEMLCVPKVSLTDLQVENLQAALAKKFKE